MDRIVTLIFEHRRDKDIQKENYTVNELIFGIGEAKQPVKDIVETYKEDGYRLIDCIL